MQGNDFLQSVMYTRGVKCSSCHDVHGTGNVALLIKPANVMCLECHGPGSPNGPHTSTIEQHTHHKAGSAGDECIACHMPKIEQTLGDQNVRSHTFRFISPAMTDAYKIPNPCTICHQDKTTGWASAQFEAMVERFTLENRAVRRFAHANRSSRSADVIAILTIVLIASVWIAFGQSQPVLRLQNTIALPGVQGRIDHMSFDPRTGRLFVAALGNNTVEVVDVNQGKQIDTIPGLHEPQGVLYLPDVNRLYVANGDTGTVELFDGTSFRVLSTVNLGSDADNVRFDPVHKKVYVGYGSGALAILEEDGSHVADVKLDAHPESFQLEQKGNRIFVNLPDSKKVGVVDRNTRRVIANWSTAGALANFPMALDEQNHRLFIVCRRPAELLVLDTASGAIVRDCLL